MHKKRIILSFFICLVIVSLFLVVKASPINMTDSRVREGMIQVEENPDLEIHEGYVSKKDETLLVKQGREIVAKVYLSAPVFVAMAEQEEGWGFFQFPSIGKADDGTLVVSWQMKEDSHTSYGKKSAKKYTPMMSKDEGKTWLPQDSNFMIHRRGYNVEMRNGDILYVRTPTAKDINTYSSFPIAVGERNGYTYYPVEQLPSELQGVYFNRQGRDGKSKKIHAELHDPGILRYAIDGQMPVVWWGNIKQLADNSLVAGVYPTFYQDSTSDVLPGSVSFYRSEDLGNSWEVISKIHFIKDGIANVFGNKSFDEPAFELLADSTFVCVMRSGATSPLYKTFSFDRGKTWTSPRPFTPNGVKPQLMLLKNGVLVLSTGRPGVQLRFSLDGKGEYWTSPIDMVPFMNPDGTFTRNVSCGYTSMIEADDNSFYIVYSDFTSKNQRGEIRKSIVFRRVVVKK